MSGPDKRLTQLHRIASIMAERALMPVADATAEVRRIEARIAEISDHRTRLTAAVGDPSIAATMLAQAERLRIKQAATLSELATARVRLDTARAAAAKAVGRDQALSRVIEKRLTAKTEKARRDPPR